MLRIWFLPPRQRFCCSFAPHRPRTSKRMLSPLAAAAAAAAYRNASSALARTSSSRAGCGPATPPLPLSFRYVQLADRAFHSSWKGSPKTLAPLSNAPQPAGRPPPPLSRSPRRLLLTTTTSCGVAVDHTHSPHYGRLR